MNRLLNVIVILLSFSQGTKAQIDIENISMISITDRLNINYEKLNSYTFEIRFKESIELWHTKQISKVEFQQEVFKELTDSVYSDLWINRKEISNRDSLKLLLEERNEYLEKAYINYCDTVKSIFIKTIPKNIIIDLLKAVQDTIYNEETFKSQYILNASASYGNKIIMTSYYPLVGMTFYSSVGDTLTVYNDGQQDLLLPWYNKNINTDLYNPLINLSLDAILPEELNLNKKRLTNGLKKK